MSMIDTSAPTAEPGSATTEPLTEWGARLDQAVAGIQQLDAESRAVAEEFALSLDQVTRTALTAIVRRLRDDPRGKELLFELVDDPAVRLVLGMHGIIRLPDPEQLERSGTAPSTGGRTFISLSSMLRGPQTADACGCGDPAGGAGADACGCGGH